MFCSQKSCKKADVTYFLCQNKCSFQLPVHAINCRLHAFCHFGVILPSTLWFIICVIFCKDCLFTLFYLFSRYECGYSELFLTRGSKQYSFCHTRIASTFSGFIQSLVQNKKTKVSLSRHVFFCQYDRTMDGCLELSYLK